MYLGDFTTSNVVYIPFDTFSSDDPSASITLTGLAVGDIKVYKNGSVTERASTSGFTLLDTDGIDFDGNVGIHGISIDLSDNSDAGFYVAGGEYWVVIASVTVDAATVNFVAGTFSIERAGGALALLKDGTFGLSALETLVDELESRLTATRAGYLDNLNGHTPQTGDNYARLGAPAGASISADVAAVKTDTGNLVTRITATLFSGITSLAQWLGLLAGKQTGDTTARTELRATGAGSGTFDETTDSVEAIRDHVGNGTNLTEAGGTGDHLTAVPWNAAWDGEVQSEVEDGLAVYDPPTRTELADDIASLAQYIDTEVAAILEDTGTTIPSLIAALNNLSAGDVAGELATYDAPTRAELTSDINSVLSKLLKYVQLLARKDVAIATDNAAELTAINADGGSGAGTFDNTTDAEEALRDRGDAAWTTGAGGSAPTVEEIRTELDTNSTKLAAILEDTGDTLPTTLAQISAYIDTEILAILQAVGIDIPNLISNLNNLSEANIRDAVGLAAANLDTQLGAIKTDTATILIDTNELQVDWTNGGRLDLIIDSILDKVGTTGVVLAAAERNAIADAMLDRDMSVGVDSGSDVVRTIRQALRFNRNKVAIVSGVLTIYKEDDITPSWTAAVTTTAGNPISAVDPT